MMRKRSSWSAMDIAKAAALLASQDNAAPESFLLGQRAITTPRRQLRVLIPTTSGTGGACQVRPMQFFYRHSDFAC